MRLRSYRTPAPHSTSSAFSAPPLPRRSSCHLSHSTLVRFSSARQQPFQFKSLTQAPMRPHLHPSLLPEIMWSPATAHPPTHNLHQIQAATSRLVSLPRNPAFVPAQSASQLH